MAKMTYAQAAALYDSGKAQFKPPPVYTGHWTRNDWIFYIFGVRP